MARRDGDGVHGLRFRSSGLRARLPDRQGARPGGGLHGAPPRGGHDGWAGARPDLLLGPQAIGGHVDHVQVVRAVRDSSPNLPILWWRDFPYLVRDADPAEPFRAEMRALPETHVDLPPGAVEAKRAACHAYASQLGFQFGGPEGLDRRLAEAGRKELFRGSDAGLLDIARREVAA